MEVQGWVGTAYMCVVWCVGLETLGGVLSPVWVLLLNGVVLGALGRG